MSTMFFPCVVTAYYVDGNNLAAVHRRLSCYRYQKKQHCEALLKARYCPRVVLVSCTQKQTKTHVTLIFDPWGEAAYPSVHSINFNNLMTGAITGCVVEQHCCKGVQPFQWQSLNVDRRVQILSTENCNCKILNYSQIGVLLVKKLITEKIRLRNLLNIMVVQCMHIDCTIRYSFQYILVPAA